MYICICRLYVWYKITEDTFFWWGQPSPIDIVKAVKKEVEFCNCTDLCFFCRSVTSYQQLSGSKGPGARAPGTSNPAPPGSAPCSP